MCQVDRSKAPEIKDFTLFKPQKPEAIVLNNGIPIKIFKNLHENFIEKCVKNFVVFCDLLMHYFSRQVS